MNTETSILVAIVIAILIVAIGYALAQGTIDQTKKSLFGGKEGDTVFKPDGNKEEGFTFPNPTKNQGQKETSLKFEGYERSLV